MSNFSVTIDSSYVCGITVYENYLFILTYTELDDEEEEDSEDIVLLKEKLTLSVL